jgi:hypothetical protein
MQARRSIESEVNYGFLPSSRAIVKMRNPDRRRVAQRLLAFEDPKAGWLLALALPVLLFVGTALLESVCFTGWADYEVLRTPLPETTFHVEDVVGLLGQPTIIYQDSPNTQRALYVFENDKRQGVLALGLRDGEVVSRSFRSE